MPEAVGRIPLFGRRTSVWKETDEVAGAGRLSVDWAVIVQQIRDGDPSGEETLYRNLAAGARMFLRRRLRTEDVDDRIHDLFLIIIETIRRGDLREPERLMGFVRTVLYRQMNLEISRLVRVRETSIDLDSAGSLKNTAPSPEEQAANDEKVQLMKHELRKMSRRDFEVLSRFYLHEQSPERIRKEMDLTVTQFDLLKTRAKARLTESVRRKIGRNRVNRE
jgi:DNA-directed RNA polymerase specialized sigma24 family protein